MLEQQIQSLPLGLFLHQIPAARSILKVEEIEEGGGWERVEGKLWVRIELVPGSLDAAAVRTGQLRPWGR